MLTCADVDSSLLELTVEAYVDVTSVSVISVCSTVELSEIGVVNVDEETVVVSDDVIV